MSARQLRKLQRLKEQEEAARLAEVEENDNDADKEEEEGEGEGEEEIKPVVRNAFSLLAGFEDEEDENEDEDTFMFQYFYTNPPQFKKRYNQHESSSSYDTKNEKQKEKSNRISKWQGVLTKDEWRDMDISIQYPIIQDRDSPVLISDWKTALTSPIYPAKPQYRGRHGICDMCGGKLSSFVRQEEDSEWREFEGRKWKGRPSQRRPTETKNALLFTVSEKHHHDEDDSKKCGKGAVVSLNKHRAYGTKVHSTRVGVVPKHCKCYDPPLHDTHPVVTNIARIASILQLKQRLALSTVKNPTKPPPTTSIDMKNVNLLAEELTTSPQNCNSIRGAVGVLAAHSGFSAISDSALDVLVDVVGNFVSTLNKTYHLFRNFNANSASNMTLMVASVRECTPGGLQSVISHWDMDVLGFGVHLAIIQSALETQLQQIDDDRRMVESTSVLCGMMGKEAYVDWGMDVFEGIPESKSEEKVPTSFIERVTLKLMHPHTEVGSVSDLSSGDSVLNTKQKVSQSGIDKTLKKKLPFPQVAKQFKPLRLDLDTHSTDNIPTSYFKYSTPEWEEFNPSKQIGLLQDS
eukprot:m.15342 g.15342  ORF g.15342 m.15342 type:complete len:575 (-) comp4460_c0_seq1:175-1899(-)